jgi:hypothetical protein
MQTTKKIAPISFTKEDLEAVLNKVRATAPKAIVEEKKEEGIVSPYVENLDSIKDEKLSDIVLQNNEGEIRTGKIEIAKLPKENTGADLGAGIKIEINNSKLQGILLARDGDYVFRAMQSRMFVLAKVGELYVPFYISSSGTSGKTEGKWYPFFGYTGSWVVKGEVKENGEMEYSSKISEVQDLLNENFKIPVKYIDLDGEIGIGDKYLNDKKKDEKGNYIVALNPKRKVIFDIKNAVKYKSWFLENKSKELSGLEEESNEIAWVQEKTGLYPTKVFNDGNGSADNWIASIVSLVEGGKKNTEPVKKEDPAQVLSSENKTEPVIEKTVVDSSLDDMTFQNKVDYIGRQIWSEQIKVPLPEFEVIILESEEEKKQLTLIQSWDLEILIKEMEEMVANKTEEAVKIGIDLLQRDIQKLKDFREKREAIKTAYELKQVEMYPNVPENFLTMTLEEKKADIERRRREKIESLPSEVSYVASNINALKRDIQVGSNTSTKKTEEMSDPEKLEYLFTNSEEFIADAIKEGNYAEPKVKSLEKELEIVKEINVRYGAELTALENKELGEKTDPLTQKLNAIVRKRGISGMRFGYEYTDFISSGLEYPDLTKELQEEQEKVLSVIREEHQTELSRKIAENEKIQKNAKGKKVESVINEGGESFNGIEKTEDKHSIFNITKNNEVEIRDEQRAMASINNILPSLYNWDEYPDKNSKIVVVKKPRVVLNTKGEASVTEKGKIVFINKI